MELNINHIKRLLFVFFLSQPLLLFAQDHTKRYISTTGDTIKVGYKLHFAEQNLHSVNPFRTKLDDNEIIRHEIYIIRYMEGSIHEVSRISRFKDGKDYRYIAVIKIDDPKLDQRLISELYVDIEYGLERKDFTIQKNK